MKIVTGKYIREWDRYTIEHEPISSISLMERAAIAIANFIIANFPPTQKLCFLAGPGNNGGDALAAARLTAPFFNDIRVFTIPSAHHSDEWETNQKRLTAIDNIHIYERFPDCTDCNDKMVLVDGLLGSGLNKPVEGLYAEWITAANSMNTIRVAIDIPSGLCCDKAPHHNALIFKAHYTLTIQAPKLSFFMREAAPYIGKVEILDIQLATEALEHFPIIYETIDREMVTNRLHKLNPFAHKGTQGHGLLITGQYGMAGAAILSARAALYSGIGKITVHTAYQNNDILQISVPESILSHDVNPTHVTIFPPETGYQAVAIGPGLGTADDTAHAFLQWLQNHQQHTPIVIDADGINLLSKHSQLLETIQERCIDNAHTNVIITPHPLEFKRLTKHDGNSSDLLASAQEWAKAHHIIVVLKGHFTAICMPNGKVYINTTGNAGMATAGSGDVLTGIIMALCAQGYSAEDAAIVGVYLHGLAGDLYAQEFCEESLTAGKLAEHICLAFKEIKKSNKQTS